MEVNVISEHGYDEALRGMSYSFKDRALPVDEWWEGQRDKAIKRAAKLAQMGNGHSDFLKQIMLWIDIEAPRYWWSEFDTYHFAWKNSESTMHTLKRRDLTKDDFEDGLILGDTLDWINTLREHTTVDKLKGALPDGYLQRRMVTTNYMSLQNIIKQRHDHRLPQWQQFCTALYEQVEHPEFLPKL